MTQPQTPAAAPLDEAAIERWRQNIRRSTFYNYQVEMGAALTGRGEFAAAQRMYDSAAGLEPASAEARFALFILPALMGGDPVGDLDGATATRGLARLLARLSRAEDQPVIDRMLAFLPDLAPQRLVRLALARWHCLAGQADAARAVLGDLCQLSHGIPQLRASDAGAAVRLAHTALALGERNLTADMLLASMEMADVDDPPPPDDSGLSRLYTLLAQRLMQRQGYADALICHRWAVTLNPANTASLAGQARALLLCDRVEEGLAMIEPAALAHPHDGGVLSFQGQLTLMGRPAALAVERLTQALTVAQNLQDNMLIAQCASHLGLAFQAAGDLDGAMAAHDAAIAARPHLGLTHANRAQALAARGDRAGARRALEEGLALGREPMALTTAALLALEDGDEKQAIALLHEARQFNPAQAWVQPQTYPWARDRLYALMRKLGFARPETKPRPSLL
jgi:tetratricopeptide (TPR) repeat protein